MRVDARSADRRPDGAKQCSKLRTRTESVEFSRDLKRNPKTSAVLGQTPPLAAVMFRFASTAYYTGVLGFEVNWQQPI
jgi:hypothetical protein